MEVNCYNETIPDKKDIIKLIKFAIKKINDKDKYLIDNRVSERAIVSKFALYFYELSKNKLSCFYDIDVEYNRQGIKTKKLGEEQVCIDFIVHKRGDPNHNLLAIEFKTYWNKKSKAIEQDKEKIRKLCDNSNEYKYKYGFTIIFEKEFNAINFSL